MKGPGSPRINACIGLIRRPFREYVVEGFSKSESGTPIPASEMSLFHTETDAREQIVVSDANALYTFYLGGDSTMNPRRRARELWWVRGYNGTGSSALFGTTLENLSAEERSPKIRDGRK